VQTGTGSKTLTVYNASVSGTTQAYIQASRWAAAVAATNPDLIFVSHGHNTGDPGTPTELQRWSMKNDMLSLTEDLALTFPRAGLVLVAQNPSFIVGRETWQAIKATFWEEIAGRRGYGFLDVHQAFTDAQATLGATALQAAYYTDTTHPNATGQSLLWFPVVDAALRDNTQSAEPVRSVPPIAQTALNLIPNGDFSTWTSTAPSGWTLSGNLTATKDSTFFETGSYSCRLDTTGTGAVLMEYAVTPASAGVKGLIDGQVVTVAARVYMASGNATTPSLIVKDNGGSGTQARKDMSTTITDRWVWIYATRRFAAGPTNFTVDLYPRISGTSAGTVYVDRVVAVVGELAMAGGATPGINAPAATVGVAQNDLDHLSTISDWPAVTGSDLLVGVRGADREQGRPDPHQAAAQLLHHQDLTLGHIRG
jgi:lysophospholipase L1-like esterase